MNDERLSVPFEKLKLLLAQDSFELLDGFRLVYLMNDAVESFLVFQNARMTGMYLNDYDGELEAEHRICDGKTDKKTVENEKSKHADERTDHQTISKRKIIKSEDAYKNKRKVHIENPETKEYVLVLRQGDSVCTLFFDDLVEEVHLYDYGDIGHFWVKGYEYLRQIEYKCAILRDKLTYMGEAYCNETEIKLAALANFPPLNYCCYPAVPEKYLVPQENPWMPSEESFEVMTELLLKVKDKKLLSVLKFYQKHPYKCVARYFAVLLHRWKHKAVVEELFSQVKIAARKYHKRQFTEAEEVKFKQLKAKAKLRIQELKEKDCVAKIYREEPFEGARDSISGKVYVLILKKQGKNLVSMVEEIL